MTDIATIPGITPSPVGLTIDDDLEIGAWAEYGERLATVEAGLMWAIGDWMLFGKAHYKEGQANTLASAVGLADKTVWNATWVCGKVAPEQRRSELSYKHHETVAAQPPEVQRSWLQLAVDDGLSVSALAERVQAAAAVSAVPRTPHVGSGRKLPIRFNVTCPVDVPAKILQEGVHHAALQLHSWLAERGYDTDIAEVL